MGKREERAKALGGVVGIVQSVVPGGSFVMVTLPTLSGGAVKHQCRIDMQMLQPHQGVVQLPEPGDEVLVGFEHGDMSRPYLLGYLWDGKDKPPPTAGGARTTGGKRTPPLLRRR